MERQPVLKKIEQQTNEELILTEKWAETLPQKPRQDYLARIHAERYKRCLLDPECFSGKVSYVDKQGNKKFREKSRKELDLEAKEELNRKIDAILNGTSTLFEKERIATLQVAINKYGLTEELFEAYAKEMRI